MNEDWMSTCSVCVCVCVWIHLARLLFHLLMPLCCETSEYDWWDWESCVTNFIPSLLLLDGYNDVTCTSGDGLELEMQQCVLLLQTL